MPVFWLAAILLYYLTYKIELFPTGGYVPLTEDPVEWAIPPDPALVHAGGALVGFYSRVLRSNMLDAMNEDYVRTARAKGLSERQVMIRHVLRNSLIPIVTLFGLDFGAVIGGGAILTETIFNLDGVGQYAAEAIDQPRPAADHGGRRSSAPSSSSSSTPSSTSPTPTSTRGSGSGSSARNERRHRCSTVARPAGRLRHRRRAACRPSTASRFDLAAGRGAGDRRRVGLGQERHRADDHRPDPLAERADRGLGRASRRGADRASDDELRQVRGEQIAMVFQDPMTSLNPVYRVGDQIVEAIRAHRDELSKSEARERAIELLDSVGIPDAERRVDDYPHEFSGGMRQRAMIAMALALEPERADRRRADDGARRDDPGADPAACSSDLNRERGLATILITHDLGVVAEVADRVLVMYAGRVVEEGTLDEIFYDPQHPYTWGLLGSLTRLDRPRPQRLPQISGAPPSLLDLPDGLLVPAPLPARVRPVHRAARRWRRD